MKSAAKVHTSSLERTDEESNSLEMIPKNIKKYLTRSKSTMKMKKMIKGEKKAAGKGEDDEDDDSSSLHGHQIGISQWRIRVFRVLLVLFLVAAGAVSGTISFIYLRNKERNKLRSELHSMASDVLSIANQGFRAKLIVLKHLSTILSYHCPNATQWPTCSLSRQYFEELSSPMVDISLSRSISINPLVYPSQQESFEAYAYDKFEKENYPNGTGISSFGKGFFSQDEEGARHADDGKSNHSEYDLFLPVFQPANIANNWRGIMYNMHSEATRAAAIDTTINCSTASINLLKSGECVSQMCSSVTDFIQLVSDTSPRPASIFFTPVFPLNDNTTLVAIDTVILNWDTILGASAGFKSEIYCTVESAVGGVSSANHTFRIERGKATYTNSRDIDGGISMSADLDFSENIASSVAYRLHFYPSRELYAEFHSLLPIIASAVCVAIIVTISLTFIGYDVLVKREALENKLLLDSKRVFVRFISHEIRTPINTIILGLQLLMSRMQSMRSNINSSPNKAQEINSSMQETITECVDLIEELTDSSNTAVVVLNDLINYDKIEMEKFRVERRVINIFAVIETTAKPLEVLAKQRGIDFCFSIDKEDSVGDDEEMGRNALQVLVIGDAIKLGQVIRNILTNALKFTPAGGRVNLTAFWKKLPNAPATDETRQYDPVTNEPYLRNGEVEIKVTDTGPGLSAEQQKKMFQEGVQFNPNELQAGQGSGLGLWISREIIKQHGGTIGVYSAGLKKGSTFTVKVPVVVPDFVPNDASLSLRLVRSHSQEIRSATEGSLMPAKVLIVDDAVSSVKILARLLKNVGIEVVQAVDGKECLQEIGNRAADDLFDLIIMDYEMPVMNGPDATRALRSNGYIFPIIGVTGNVLPEDKAYFIESGADFVLPKPLNLDTLLESYKVIKRRLIVENVE